MLVTCRDHKPSWSSSADTDLYPGIAEIRLPGSCRISFPRHGDRDRPATTGGHTGLGSSAKTLLEGSNPRLLGKPRLHPGER